MPANPLRMLIAEDDPTNAIILEDILTREGYQVLTVTDGEAAYEALQKYQFAALLTDWMMPKMDGLQLICKVRASITPVPAILMITSISAESAIEHSLQSGADDYIVKPYKPKDILTALHNVLAIQEETQKALPVDVPTVLEASEKQQQALPILQPTATPSAQSVRNLPPFLGVGIMTNTGGPNALSKLFQELPNTDQAVFLLIVQTPAWALEMFAMRLQKQTPLKVVLADDGMTLTGGTIYIARKDRHLLVAPNGKLQYLDAPEVHHSRPSGDVLLKSMADVFGSRAIGVGLTGIGRDGLAGMAHISAAGGKVVVQDPSTADAPYFPQAVLDMKINAQMASLSHIAKGLAQLAQKQA